MCVAPISHHTIQITSVLIYLTSLQTNSFDNELNNHGKRLLEICRSADLRILNGRTSGDTLGRPTFHGKSGVSIVDYAICDQDLFRHIANFIVREPLSLSDHSPIMTWLNVNTVSDHSATTNINDTLVRIYVYLNSLLGKEIPHLNLEPHCSQETYRECYMISLLITVLCSLT